MAEPARREWHSTSTGATREGAHRRRRKVRSATDFGNSRRRTRDHRQRPGHPARVGVDPCQLLINRHKEEMDEKVHEVEVGG